MGFEGQRNDGRWGSRREGLMVDTITRVKITHAVKARTPYMMRGSGVQVLDLSHNFSEEKHLQKGLKEIKDSREKHMICSCQGNT